MRQMLFSKRAILFVQVLSAGVLLSVFFQNCGGAFQSAGSSATPGESASPSTIPSGVSPDVTPQGAVTPGSATSLPAAQGQILGSCMYQTDGAFVTTTAPTAKSITWPMLSCDAAQKATCAEGFSVANETPVQMNCATNSSAEFVPCYWATKRCVRTTGSQDPSAFQRGQSYGGCLQQLKDNFSVDHVDGVFWPMLSCGADGVEKCASGFTAVRETPVQMNCSPTPSKTNALNCYWMTTRCVKL